MWGRNLTTPQRGCPHLSQGVGVEPTTFLVRCASADTYLDWVCRPDLSGLLRAITPRQFYTLGRVGVLRFPVFSAPRLQECP